MNAATVDSTEVREAWAQVTDALRDALETVVYEDSHIESDLARMEGARYLARLFCMGVLSEIELDPAYPVLARTMSPWLNYGLPNQDTAYLQVNVDSAHTYRIRGNPGTAHMFTMDVYNGSLSDMQNVHVTATRAEFQRDVNGEIDVVLSAEERDGDWLPLAPGRSWVYVRQVFYDWETEQVADLTIEREGAAYPAPAPTATDLTDQLQRLLGVVQRGSRALSLAAQQHYRAPADRVPFPPISLGTERDHEDQIGLEGQYYGAGHYRCAEDEAVILEFTPPAAHYWSVGLIGQYWDALDWRLRQSSLNGHQAVIDADGVFRAVIAQRDPGVPNWLDTAGHEVGLLTVRYYLPGEIVEPSLRTVSLARVREELPTETPVVTPEQRQDALRRRALQVRRKFW
jgi:hypothetical protein